MKWRTLLPHGICPTGMLVFYDVTSVYVKVRKCPLTHFVHNRDGKKGKMHIVVGLLCSSDGCPVSVELFEGNTADPKTPASQKGVPLCIWDIEL